MWIKHKVQLKKQWTIFEIPIKLQTLTMKPLFGRFQHLVEDIFGLLNEKSLTCCSQIDKLWNTNLEECRLRLVKKTQKCLKNQSLPPICPTGNLGHPLGQAMGPLWDPWTAIEKNVTIEQLPLPFLVQFLRYFSNYKLKVYEVNFRIISIKKTSVIFGIFMKNKQKGCQEDVIVVSRKISGDTSEASNTLESKINITVCKFLSGFLSQPVSIRSLFINDDNLAPEAGPPEYEYFWCRQTSVGYTFLNFKKRLRNN